MPSFIEEDTIIAQNFFLEIDGEVVTYLSGVSGLDIEMEHSEVVQAITGGKKVLRKMLGGHIKAPDLQLTRVAPSDSTKDELWKWFNDIMASGMSLGARGEKRKNGSIVLFDSTLKEVARFNFFNGWPSKISTDGLSVDSNDPVKETITIVCERLERVK